MGIVCGIPDVIRCSSAGSLFYLHSASRSPDSKIWYTQIRNDDDRTITFNLDGSFNGRSGDHTVSSDCYGKSIDELYKEGKAFNLLQSKTISGSYSNLTIANGWPDALACGASLSGTGAILFLHSISGGGWYVQIYNWEERLLRFDGSGNFYSRTGHASTTDGCVGKGINQLYSEGRAFNLVAGRSSDKEAASSIMPNWPDALACGDGNGGGAILFQSSIGFYTQIYNFETRYITFDLDGNYYSRNGHPSTTDGCINKKITQLYQEGRAFNLVASKIEELPLNHQTMKCYSPSPVPSPIPSSLLPKPSSSPAPAGDMCLTIRKITLSSPGDIDRTTEELEVVIYVNNDGVSWNADCGLFLFNTTAGILDRDINIKVPCIGGNYVGLRFIERDVCNDDIVYFTVDCEASKNERVSITIPADNTVISQSKCQERTSESQVCVNAGNKIIGGGFCSTYTWSRNECTGIDMAETDSSYVMLYDIVEGSCSFDSSALSNNAVCKSEEYTGGPVCELDNYESSGVLQVYDWLQASIITSLIAFGLAV